MEWSSLIVIGMVLMLLVGGWAFLKSILGPLGNALQELFGLAAAVGKMLQDAVNDCKKDGWWPWQGCPITIAGVVAVAGTLLFRFMLNGVDALFRQRPVGQNEGPKGELGDRLVQINGREDAVTTPDMEEAKRLMERAKDLGGGTDVQQALSEELITRRSLQRARTITEAGSPEAKAQYNSSVELAKTVAEATRSKLSEEGKRAYDEAARDLPPEPEPFEV